MVLEGVSECGPSLAVNFSCLSVLDQDFSPKNARRETMPCGALTRGFPHRNVMLLCTLCWESEGWQSVVVLNSRRDLDELLKLELPIPRESG